MRKQNISPFKSRPPEVRRPAMRRLQRRQQAQAERCPGTGGGSAHHLPG